MRRVPLRQAMARKLQQLRPDGAAPEAPVFASRVGTPLSYSGVYNRVLRPALRDSGIATKVMDPITGKERWDYQRVAFHAFRKACGSLLFAHGKTLVQVQGWLGHAEVHTTERHYLHQVDGGLGSADVWDKIAPWGHRGAPEQPQTAADADQVEHAETGD